MAIVQLKANWPGNFRRTVRGPKGEELRVLEWKPGESHDLKGEDLDAVADDLGVCLQVVSFNEALGKLVPVESKVEKKAPVKPPTAAAGKARTRPRKR